MKNTLIGLAAFLLILSACTNNSNPSTSNQAASQGLEKLWESDTVFTTAESALFDEATNTIYVSNIEGEPWGSDSTGSIGKLSPEGKVIAAKWVTGLNAPKGLAIANGKLYTADMTQLVEVDLATGKITNKYTVPDAVGLNDVTNAPDGTIFFTDSEKGAVYQLKKGAVSKVLEGLGGSNGILYEKDRLLLGIWKDSTLMAYQFADKKQVTLGTQIPQPDGIEAVGDGSYLVSSWKGLIHQVYPDGHAMLILDTAKDNISAADIDYVKAKKMILVPTFFRNSIAAYELK